MNAWPVSLFTRRIDPVTFAVSMVVGICAALVLIGVASSFFEARRAGEVERRQRSVVATGRMLLFFAGVFVLLRTGVGVVPVGSRVVRIVLAIVGLVPVVVGCAVNLLGRIRLGANWANQATVYRNQTLVTAGIFAWVRHPLYASLIWMSIGASVAYRNWAALAATLLVFVPAMHHRAGQEEALLEQRFPEYRDYRSHVGRLFPRLFRGASS
jgi:protein-S-isoprenylcysteine O-methyltransferase Ste14